MQINLEISKIQQTISKKIGKYQSKWSDLSDEARQLANSIVADVEWVGGSRKASEIMKVSSSSIDNYRFGSTQPDAIQYSRLITAAEERRIDLHMVPIKEAQDQQKNFSQEIKQLQEKPINQEPNNKAAQIGSSSLEAAHIITTAGKVAETIAERIEDIPYDPKEFGEAFRDLLEHAIKQQKNEEEIGTVVDFQAERISRKLSGSK